MTDYTYTSYDMVGVKEDVSDVISNISPTKTPFQTAIGNEKVTQKVFDWQEDTLKNVTDNNHAEGFTASESEIAPTSLRENVTQILSDTIKIAGTSDATSTYGRAKESAYQLAKLSAQLKRDLENAFVGTGQALVKPANNTTNRKMAGFQAQIDSSTIVKSGASDGTKPFIEADLLTCLQDIFNNGGDATAIHLTPTNAPKMADFAKAAGRYRTIESGGSRADQSTIVNVVNLYVSPFGEQRVVLNRFQKAGDTLVFDPAMWAKCTLRPWTREPLAKVGDAQ